METSELSPKPAYELQVNRLRSVEAAVTVRRFRAAGSRVECWRGDSDELGTTLHEAARLVAYAATCKLRNRGAWLAGLAERCNALLTSLGDPDRVRVNRGELAIVPGVPARMTAPASGSDPAILPQVAAAEVA